MDWRDKKWTIPNPRECNSRVIKEFWWKGDRFGDPPFFNARVRTALAAISVPEKRRSWEKEADKYIVRFDGEPEIQTWRELAQVDSARICATMGIGRDTTQRLIKICHEAGLMPDWEEKAREWFNLNYNVEGPCNLCRDTAGLVDDLRMAKKLIELMTDKIQRFAEHQAKDK